MPTGRGTGGWRGAVVGSKVVGDGADARALTPSATAAIDDLELNIAHLQKLIIIGKLEKQQLTKESLNYRKTNRLDDF